jgi:hypothetical protein
VEDVLLALPDPQVDRLALGRGRHGRRQDLPQLVDAARALVTVERTIQPDAARHEEYRFDVDKYIDTCPLLREVIRDTVRHVSGAGVPAPSAEGAYDLPTEVKDES